MPAPITFATLLRALFGSASILFFLAASPCALADDLDTVLTVHKVVQNAEGGETLVSAEESNPGDLLEYAASYRNGSDKLIKNLAPLLPIPAGTAYENATAQPAPSDASVDGTSFEPVPLKHTVTLADGTKEEQLVPPAEYRALRWSIDELPPGAETKVTARVRVVTSPEPQK